MSFSTPSNDSTFAAGHRAPPPLEAVWRDDPQLDAPRSWPEAAVLSPPPPATRLDTGFHLAMLLGAMSIVGLAALLQIRPDERVTLFGYLLPESCSWKVQLGLNCPGCGLTRSFISLAHLRPLEAWRFNPAGWLLFSGVLFQIPYRTWALGQVWRGIGPRSLPLSLLLTWLVASLVVLLAQWVAHTGWGLAFGGG